VTSAFFDRSYEKTYGYLKIEDFPSVNWAVKEEIELLFPPYQRAMLARGGKGAIMGTGIELTLNLRTPYNDRDLFLNTVLEL